MIKWKLSVPIRHKERKKRLSHQLRRLPDWQRNRSDRRVIKCGVPDANLRDRYNRRNRIKCKCKPSTAGTQTKRRTPVILGPLAPVRHPDLRLTVARFHGKTAIHAGHTTLHDHQNSHYKRKDFHRGKDTPCPEINPNNNNNDVAIKIQLTTNKSLPPTRFI